MTFTVDGKGNRFAADCVCREMARIERQMRAAGLPDKYTEKTFADYDAKHDTQRMAMLYAQRYVSEWPMHEGRGLCFIGPPGTGKTHLAIAILRELVLTRGARGLYTSPGRLSRQVKASYGDSKEQEGTILEPVLRAELLVLDDVGVNRVTEWETEQMEYLIGERYEAGRPTIITSNLRLRPSPRRVESAEVSMYRQAATTDSLVERLGARVASRLGEMCRILPVEGPDHRLTAPGGMGS